MGIPLTGLDIPVLVPAAATERLEAVGGGYGPPGEGDPTCWEDVTVAPVAPDGVLPGWSVRTLARRGCRPLPDGAGWTLDPDRAGAAGTAVLDLLLQQIPAGLPREEVRRRIHAAGDTGDEVAGRLGDPGVWEQGVLTVDGAPFVRWLHRRAEGLAAVADLGHSLLIVQGERWPGDDFRLLAPAQARAVLG
ncbi:hypothetical protein [Blastococcus sp. SYSU D00820]